MKIMKIFLITATLAQLVLLILSKYYGFVADGVLQAAVEAQDSNILMSLDNFQHYRNLDDNLGYMSTSIWVLVVIITLLKSVSSTKMGNLAICLPLVFNMILMLM